MINNKGGEADGGKGLSPKGLGYSRQSGARFGQANHTAWQLYSSIILKYFLTFNPINIKSTS